MIVILAEGKKHPFEETQGRGHSEIRSSAVWCVKRGRWVLERAKGREEDPLSSTPF